MFSQIAAEAQKAADSRNTKETHFVNFGQTCNPTETSTTKFSDGLATTDEHQ